MTCPEDEKAALELRLRVEDDEDEKRSYAKLSEGLVENVQESEQEKEEEDEETASSSPFWFWVKLAILLAFLAALAVVAYRWVGPLIMDKELIPIIKWEIRTFTHPVCGLLVFASVAVFPTILVPSTPSMWIAGMTFGYGYGFLLIISAAAVGVSLPYFIGHLFRHKIQRESCKDISRSIFCRRTRSLGYTDYSQHSRLFRNCSYHDSHHQVCEKTAGDHEERGRSTVAINPRDKL